MFNFRLAMVVLTAILLCLNAGCSSSGPDPVLWVKTWGGPNDVSSFDVDIGESGNIFVAGNFFGTDIDFDPGPGEECRTAQSSRASASPFLSCFGPDGEFIWVRTWDGINTYFNDSVTLTSTGIYFGYTSRGELDLDPGEGTDTFTVADGHTDSFLTRLDLDGNYLWTHVWERDIEDPEMQLDLDEFTPVDYTQEWDGDTKTPNIQFANIVPDSNGNVIVANLNEMKNAFDDTRILMIDKLDPDGNVLWEWEAELPGPMFYRLDVAVGPDDSVYAYGNCYFSLRTDFDSDPDVEEIIAFRDYQSFLLKLDPDGDFVWVKTWDGSANSIAFDEAGGIYVVGGFILTGEGEHGRRIQGLREEILQTHGLPEEDDIRITFLSKLTSDGELMWVSSWIKSTCDRVAVTSDGLVLATGVFKGRMDFDPGESRCIRTSRSDDGSRFLSVFEPDGEFRGVHEIRCGFKYDIAAHVRPGFELTCDESGYAYLVGGFSEDARFGTSRENWRTSEGPLAYTRRDEIFGFVQYRRYDSNAYLLKLDPRLVE